MNVSPSGGDDGSRSVDVEINLVPFIDMMSCLVGFLLVTAVWTQLAQIPTRPAGQGGAEAASTSRPRLSLLFAGDSLWLGATDGPPRQIVDREGEHDWATLGSELATLAHGSFAGRDDIEIAGEDGVQYQAIIAAMDFAIAAGFTNVGYVDPASLSVRFRL